MLAEFPEMKGFSYKNLRSIRQWRVFYDGDAAIWKQPVSKLDDAFFEVPWGHHLYVLQRCKTSEKGRP